MYLMYVDESGDPGTNIIRSRFYILSALVVHETAWRTVLDRLVQFRRRMKGLYKVRQNREIHASVFTNGTLKENGGIPFHHRMGVLRGLVGEMAQLPGSVNV